MDFDSGLLRRDAVGVPSSMFDHIGAGLSGLVSAKSKVWGAVILSVSVIALLMGSILLALMADLDAWSFLMGSAWSGMWGSLPAILTIGMLATLAIGEVVIWRQIFRFAVR